MPTAVVLLVIAGNSTALQLGTFSPTRGSSVSMQSWGGLFDAVTKGARGGTVSNKNDGGVITPKSRVKLGDLSVSPMGECAVCHLSKQLYCCCGIVDDSTRAYYYHTRGYSTVV